jgi:hypothetical protein
MLYLFIVGFGNVVVECGIIFEPLVIRYGQWEARVAFRTFQSCSSV